MIHPNWSVIPAYLIQSKRNGIGVEELSKSWLLWEAERPSG
jgi:hypothetical protein